VDVLSPAVAPSPQLIGTSSDRATSVARNLLRSFGGARRILTLAGAALVVALAVDFSRKKPSPAAEGTTLGSPTSAAATAVASEHRPLRVGTFNIQGCRGGDQKYDPDRTARTLRGCDLVGLNEVHGALPWHPADQAEILGRKLDVPWLFAPTERRWWHDDFGNGVLTTLPVTHWQRFPIATAASRSNRNALVLRLMYRQKPLNVVITHLDRHEDHDAQLRTVSQLFLSLSEPALLMGDLNGARSMPAMRELCTAPGVTDVTSLAPGDHRDSDWIFARGLRCVRADLINEGASDHPFYWADLDLDLDR
jgi:endonuclease/exonuclease/phosphatase family metal-dependent hydrolase